LKYIVYANSRREIAEKDRILRWGYKILHMKSVGLFTKVRTVVKENVVTHSRGKNFFQQICETVSREQWWKTGGSLRVEVAYFSNGLYAVLLENSQARWTSILFLPKNASWSLIILNESEGLTERWISIARTRRKVDF